MSLTEQIFAQASLLVQDLEGTDQELLKLFCQSAAAYLKAKLRPGLEPEDLKADFVAAASLYAVAALSETGEQGRIDQFTAGDLTLRRSSGNAAACCLRYQAELMMLPYTQGALAFMGV